MPEMRIDISELKGEGSDLIKELVDFVKDKTKADVKTETSEIVVTGETEAVSKTYLRVLIRKFLHRKELKEFFRVLGCKENKLLVKELKVKEEEE
jgi:hypothetical protein